MSKQPIKKIDKEEGLNVLSSILKGDMELSEDHYRTKGKNWIVSTVIAPDTRLFETAIRTPQTGYFKPVEQYKTQKEAKEGHNLWVKRLEENPNRSLKDLDLWNLGIDE